MRIFISTLQATLKTPFAFRCPHCGKTHTDVYEHKTATLNIPFFDSYKATQKKMAKAQDLMTQNTDPNTYLHLRLSHRCPECKIAPPWTKWKHKWLKYSAWFFGFYGFLLLAMAVTRGMPLGGWILTLSTLSLFLVSLISFIVLRKSFLRKLNALQPEDFPVFILNPQD